MIGETALDDMDEETSSEGLFEVVHRPELVFWEDEEGFGAFEELFTEDWQGFTCLASLSSLMWS